MKIAVWHNLPSGGGKRALHDHVKGLSARGHEITVWAPDTADNKFLPLSEYIHKEVIVPVKKIEINTKSVSGRFKFYLNTYAIDAMEEHSRICADEINKGGFDVALIHSCYKYFVPYIGKYLKIPNVLYLHEPDRVIYEARPILPWVSNDYDGFSLGSISYYKKMSQDILRVYGLKYRAKKEWENVRSYQQVLVNSYYSRESVLRCLGVRPKVCYLGVDVSRFILSEDKENYIVGLGEFAIHKNVEFVIDSLHHIKKGKPKLKWIANAVDEDYKEQMLQKAKDKNVEIEILKSVPEHELVGILGRAAALVYPSFLEPFGYAPLEANACGTAVIAIAEAGMRETIHNGINGYLIETNEEMAERISNLNQDIDGAISLGRMARKYVEEKWDLDSSIDRIEKNLYRIKAETDREKCALLV